MEIKPKINYGYGEVSPFDDLQSVQRNGKTFEGYNHSPENKKWAKETHDKAQVSVWCHLIEFPLKIISYFLKESDSKDSNLAKFFSSAEDLAGAFGDMNRNQIYAHRDSTGKYDDNIGAELFADNVTKENQGWKFPEINNFIQTKLKFLLSPLSLISPELANDIEWAGIRSVDACWWRKITIDRAFGNGFWEKAYNRIFKSSEVPEENQLTLDFIKKTFNSHWSSLKENWGKYKNSSEKDNPNNLINCCDSLDKTISICTPIIHCLNIFGDISRPIVRRLGIEGIPRNAIRILSVIDKPLNWMINIVRYYIPETVGKSQHHPSSIADAPNTLLAATVGDMIDFCSVIFEDKVKELGSGVNHFVEILRRTNNSANDLYLSSRRRRAQNDSQHNISA